MERERKRRSVRRLKDVIAPLTPEERAYAAELVDRDGAIYIATLGRGQRRSLHPIVTVASAEREAIDWLVTHTGSGVTALDVPTSLRAQPMFRFRVTGERAILLCEVLLPHLRAKAEQARFVAAFPMDADTSESTGAGLDDTVEHRRERVRDAVYALNHPPNGADTIRSKRRKGILPLRWSA